MNPAIIDNMSWAMAEVYAAVTDRIMINLAHHFPYVQHDMHMGSFEYQSIMLAQMGKVEKETIAIIAGSLGNADEALKLALETAILEGLKNEEPKLRQAAMQGLLNGGVPQLAPSQMQAFTYYYQQSADRLNLVNTVMLESTKAAYQSTVADISQKIATTQSILNASAGEVITGVSTWNKAMHDGVQKMVKNGLTGFVDHGGHKWSPEAYVAMDVRTTMFNTARQATWERQEQYGSDLYQVSSHNGARPLCYPWQGKVISTSGRTGITQDIDGNEVIIHSQDEIESFRYGGGLFGVNCGHYPMTFIPNFSSLKGEPQGPETNAKEYAESQQQRALERKLREEKRDLEVMKAQGASPEDIAKQRERVRSASADIDQFCDETGRARKRNREYAPVNAEFPDVPPTPPTQIRLGDDNIPQMQRSQIMIGGNQPPIDNSIDITSPNRNISGDISVPAPSKQENIDWIFEDLKRPNKSDYVDYDEYLRARDVYNERRIALRERTEQWFNTNYNGTMTEEEFTHWAERKGIKKVGSFDGIDQRTLSSYAKRFDKQIGDFPEVLESAQKFGAEYKVTYTMAGETFIAEATQGMEFNGSFFNDLERVLFAEIDSVKTGFSARGADPITQVYDHEFGHHVYRTLKSRYFDGAGNPLNGGMAKIKEIEEDLRKSLVGKKGISEYATTDYDELFAEGFAAWYGGNKSEFATAFGEFMARWW